MLERNLEIEQQLANEFVKINLYLNNVSSNERKENKLNTLPYFFATETEMLNLKELSDLDLKVDILRLNQVIDDYSFLTYGFLDDYVLQSQIRLYANYENEWARRIKENLSLINSDRVLLIYYSIIYRNRLFHLIIKNIENYGSIKPFFAGNYLYLVYTFPTNTLEVENILQKNTLKTIVPSLEEYQKEESKMVLEDFELILENIDAFSLENSSHYYYILTYVSMLRIYFTPKQINDTINKIIKSEEKKEILMQNMNRFPNFSVVVKEGMFDELSELKRSQKKKQ